MKNCLKIGVFLILVTIFSNEFCYSQNPVYFKIGEEEFANTEVYSVLYDAINDVIYAGTNSGLYAYKQNHFVPIKKAKNQKGNAVFSLKQNSNGDVYCKNLNGQLLKVTTNHLELIYETREKNKSASFWYYFVENKQLLVVTNNSIKKVNRNGKTETLFYKKNTIRISNETSSGIFFHLSYTKKGEYILQYKEKQLKKIRNTNRKEISIITNFIEQKNKLYAKDKFGKFLNLSKEPLKIKFKAQIKENFITINSNLVIALSVQKGARFIYLNKGNLTASKTFFKNTFLSTFAVSKNGTLLFGTFNDGIIIVPNYKVSKTTVANELFLGIATSPNNNIGLSTRSGAIYSYKNTVLKQIDKVPHNVDAIYYFDTITPKANLKNQFIYNKIGSAFVGSKDIVAINSNMFLFSNQTGLELINFNSKLPFKNLDYLNYYENNFVLIPKQRTKALAWNKKDSIIYFGTYEGLFKKGWRTANITPVLINNKPLFVNDITMVNNTLLCGSNEGVVILKDEKPIFKLHKKEGLLANSVKQVMQKDSILYILTKKGMQLYNMKTKQFLGFGVKEGVVAKNIKRFTLSNDKLWLLEKNSFSSIVLNSITDSKKNTISKLYLDSILVNNKKIDFLKQKKFSHTDNQFTFYVDYRNIETKAETTINYMLKGVHKKWQTISSSQNEIKFQSLPTGKYTFKVKATYRNKTTKPFIYTFTVSPPFWRTVWFYEIIAMVLAAFIFFRFRQLKRKNIILFEKQKLKTDLLDSELKALRSQMNPHFIFNSLNSIQGLILQENTNASYDYIVLFANLVRNTLNYSNKDFIPIQDELEFLDVYLKLEKLRFGDDFTYSIDYKGDKEINVPSLIVQPFIENALLHGLLHKKGEKKLHIKFHLTSTLTCTIIDNGVGREKAKEIELRQGKTYESFAIKAIEKRLEILSKKSGIKTHFTITDLYDNDIPKGTKVEINLPYKTIF